MLEGVIDLSVPFFEGMPTDDLGPKVWVRLSHAASRRIYNHTQSREGRVFLTTDHVGTHMDGPLRFDPNGLPVEKIPLERTIRPARMFDLRALGRTAMIGPSELTAAGGALEPGEAAVLWTGHDSRIKSPDYFWHRPQLTADGAGWLVTNGAGIVAADFPGLGSPLDERFEVKRILHRGGALTVEQLCNLAALSGKSWHLCAPPLRTRGAAGSLVRAVGLVGWRGRELVDLTLDLYAGMLPLSGAVPTFWNRASHDLTSFFYKGELSYQTTSMLLQEHAGTHLDAPYHFDEHGPAIHALPLERLYARARVLDFTHKKPLEGIGPEDFDAAMGRAGGVLEPGDAMVVWTGHSKNYERPDYASNRPFITAEGADWIVERHPALGLLVTDLIGLDEYVDPVDPVHIRLLMAGIPFVQVTTNLDRLAAGEWFIAAFPLKLVEGTGAPLRVFAAAP